MGGDSESDMLVVLMLRSIMEDINEEVRASLYDEIFSYKCFVRCSVVKEQWLGIPTTEANQDEADQRYRESQAPFKRVRMTTFPVYKGGRFPYKHSFSIESKKRYWVSNSAEGALLPDNAHPQ